MLIIGGKPAFFLLSQNTLHTLSRSELPYPENIAFVTRDSAGFYWFGNDNGLTCFDGGSARHIPIQSRASGVTHDQNVQSRMYPDRAGRLWFTTYAALHAFDPRTETFFTYQIETAKGAVTEDYRAFFYHAPRDEIWLRAGDSLYAYTISRKQHRLLGGPTRSINYAVSQKSDGGWRVIGSPWWNGPGVEVFDTEGGTRRLRTTDLIDVDQMVVAVAVIDESNYYLAGVRGLLHARITADTVRLASIPDRSNSDYVTSGVVFDPERYQLFVSRPREGVFRYDILADEWHPFSGPTSDEPEPTPRDLYLDPTDILWISYHRRGLDYVLLGNSRSARSSTPDLSVTISDIAYEAPDSIALLSIRGNYYRAELSRTGASDWEEATDWTGGQPSPRNPKFFRDGSGLFVTGQQRLYYRQLGKTAWRHYLLAPSQLRDMLTSPGGSRRLLISKGTVQEIDLLLPRIRQEAIPEITAAENKGFIQFLPLSPTEFLLARQGNAIWHCRWKNERIRVIERLPTPGDVYSLSPYRADTLLLGTSQGLYYWTGRDIRPIDYPSFLFSTPAVRSMVRDTAGRVWIGTENGLFRLTALNEPLVYFSEADGLPSNRFLQTPGFTAENGLLYMATDRGLAAIRHAPARASARTDAPYIQGIWVNKTPLIATHSPRELTKLRLSYAENTLGFQLGLIGLRRSVASGLLFRLIGYEDREQWVEPGGFARYPNLPPGDYALRIAAVDKNGIRGREKQLSIHIVPPFYQTWWFQIIIALLVLLLIGGTYLLLLRREINKQRLLREQQARIAAERDRIAGEVHDDLGGQLSSILFLSEEILLLDDAQFPFRREMKRIHELSRDSLVNIRDIIFALDNRRGSVTDLVNRLERYGQQFFADHGIAFSKRSTLVNAGPYELSSRQKRNLSQIVKEAFHNIVKHAGAGWVRFSAESAAGDTLVLRISDDGKGFSTAAGVLNESEEQTPGYGLINMRQKAEAIAATIAFDSRVGEGTTITVTIKLDAAPRL